MRQSSVAGRLGRFLRSVTPVLAAALALGDLTGQEERDRTPVVALVVGTVHPVSGPAIENGVVLMRGRKIVAVGAASEVEIPEDAEVVRYPGGHAYPGLVDAMSTAFCDSQAFGQAKADAGTDIRDGLDPFDQQSRDLIESGITTAYVSNRTDGSTWRGLGIVVRPEASGYSLLGDDGVAEHVRMTSGPGATHGLTRHKQLAAIGKEFDGLKAYEKGFEEFEEKQKKYDEEFEKYLAYYREKKSEKEAGGEDPEQKPARGERSGEERRQRGTPPEGGQRGGPPPGGRRGQGRGGRRTL